MADFAGYETQPNLLPHLTNFSIYGACFLLRNVDSAINPVSANWTSSDHARYYPMSIPFPYPVRRVFWANGSSGSGNRCFAIYTKDYQQIYTTGSVATSGGTALQYVTPSTLFTLQPGDYYFGFNSSTTTNGVWGKAVDAIDQRFAGILQQAVGATALPNPMVPAAASVATVNICGVTWTESGFA
jgi:hypothetical protein